MVEVKSITFSYPRTGKKVLCDVSFELKGGDCIGVLGNNGIGKSTLLKCIDRIYKSSGASILVDGEDVLKMTNLKLAQTIAYVPQMNEPVNMTVYDAIMLGRKPYIKWDATKEDEAIVENIICEMGLLDYVLRNVSELSGGEVQKVMLARALAQQPKFLLLDEPTSNLDPRNQHEMMQLIRQMAKKCGFATIIVIHDLNLALRYCDKFLFLKDGRVYSCGGQETMTPEAIREVYGMDAHVINYMGVPMIVPYPGSSAEIRKECSA